MKNTFSPFYLLTALPLLGHRKLRILVIAPVLINLLIFMCIFYFSLHYYETWVQWVVTQLPHWLDWLKWLLWILFAGIFGLFMLVTFTILGNVIASPFNSFLAEKTQNLVTGAIKREARSKFWPIKEVGKSIKRQFKIILYYLPRVLLLAIGSLIPVVQLFVLPLWFVFSAWMMAMQFLDYPFENNEKSFVEMKQAILQKPVKILMLGTASLLLLMIPFINCIVFPLCTIAATLFYCDEF